MTATTSGADRPLPGTAQRIRASALTLYARRGPEGVGVREIAADAGAASGLIRHHFGSKAGLTRAVDDLVLAVIAEALAEATSTGAPAAEVSAARDRAFARVLQERPDIAGYLRWCLIIPAPAASGQPPGRSGDQETGQGPGRGDGLVERLVDLTLEETRRLRRGGVGGTRDLRSSVLRTMLRQVGSMVLQPLADRLWDRLEPAADPGARDAGPPRVSIAVAADDAPDRPGAPDAPETAV